MHFVNRNRRIKIFFINTCRKFNEENDTSITVHKENIFRIMPHAVAHDHESHGLKRAFTFHEEIIFQIADHENSPCTPSLRLSIRHYVAKAGYNGNIITYLI